jgi:hypothetical protein
MNESTEAETPTQKTELLHRVHDQLQAWHLEPSRPARIITPLETAMRIVVGVTILAIGLVAVLMGIPRLFSTNPAESTFAGFLVFGGMVAALTGSSLMKFYYGTSLMVGRLLFGLCFVISTLLMVVGLVLAFTSIGISTYLLVIGFLGAVISALALK